MYSSTAQYALYNTSNTATAPSTFSTTSEDVVISKPEADSLIVTEVDYIININMLQELAEVL